MPDFPRPSLACVLLGLLAVGCKDGLVPPGSGSIPGPAPSGDYGTVSAAYDLEPLVPEACQRDETYYVDQRCTADGGKVYVAKSIAGTTASTGGPTGTTATIAEPLVDGTVQWVYAGPLSAMSVFYACDCQDGGASGGATSSCQAGNDSNDGTSPDRAWQSWDKIAAKYNEYAAGSTLALCRGGKWRVPAASHRLFNLNCTAANPCTIRDYGQGSLPILALVANGGAISLIDLENGGGAQHKEGLRLLNLDLENNGVSGNAWAIYLFNDQNYVTLGNLVINGFSIAVHVAGGQTPLAGADVHNDHIALIGSKVTNNSTQGWLGGGDDETIFANYFYNNGSDNMFDHTIYTGQSARLLIANNQITAGWNGACTGVVIVAHQQYNGITIEGNIIEAPSKGPSSGTTNYCWGISIDDIGHPEVPGNVVNALIRRNTVRNVGGVGIGIANSVNAVVEDNLVIQDNQSDKWPMTAIAVPDAWSAAQGGNSPGTVNTGSVVQNNTAYFSSTAPGGLGFRIGGSEGNEEGASYKVVNNVVFYEGSKADGFDCFSYGNPASAYDLIDYNLCYAPNAGGDNVIWEAISGNTFAAWKAAHGNFDQHSFLADPLFMDVGKRDFTPAASSPLLGHADPDQYSPIDLGGKDRDLPPDIGAIEWRPSTPDLSLTSPLKFEFTFPSSVTEDEIRAQTGRQAENIHNYIMQSYDFFTESKWDKYYMIPAKPIFQGERNQ